jgi:FG-GAP-like repeat
VRKATNRRRAIGVLAVVCGWVQTLGISSIHAVEPSATSGLTAVDRASNAGISQRTKSYGTYVRDFDRDGDQDFLYNRHAGSAMLLYANDGSGSFSLRTTAFPLNDRHDCVWARIDQDARPDFYCAVGGAGGRLTKANELWLQGPNGHFTSAQGSWGATDPRGRGREPALFDVNNDGLLDLFVGNHYPRPDGRPTRNRFYIQRPAGSFRSASGYGIDREIGGQCAEPADFNRDGFTDLMVCAYGGSGGLKLYANRRGAAFTNVSLKKGITGRWCDAIWVKLNADRRVDLAMMNANSFRIMLQRRDGTFRVVYRRSMEGAGCRFGGGGNRIAAGDVNMDGAPDLYILYSGYTEGRYNLPDVFLVNDGTGRRFTRATLPQTSQGSGFSVYRIQADADLPMEFLVTNGRASFRGPIQLIDFIG